MAAYCSGIRICILNRWKSVKDWGFTLHSALNRRGARYIAAVQPNSPAAYTGLRAGDRIVEINYVNICYAEHDEVVNIIESCEDTMMLLVVDEQTDIAYQNMQKCIHSHLPNILLLVCPKTEPESTHVRRGRNHNLLEKDAESQSTDEVTGHLDIPSQEQDVASAHGKDNMTCFMSDQAPDDELQRSTGEATPSSKKSLFTRLRQILRRRHRKKDDHDRTTSSTSDEREEQAATPLPHNAESEDCAETSLPPDVEREDCAETSLPPAAEHDDCGAMSLPPAAERVECGVTSLPTAAKHDDCGATSFPPTAVREESGVTSLPTAAESDDCAATSLPSDCGAMSLPTAAERDDRGAKSLPAAVEREECGASSSTAIDTHSEKKPLIEIIHRMLSQRRLHTNYHRRASLTFGATKRSYSYTAEREECGAMSLPPADEPERCEERSSTTVERDECRNTLPTNSDPRYGKQPLIERIHRMLSRTGHRKHDCGCTSLISGATKRSLSPTTERKECETTSLPRATERVECADTSLSPAAKRATLSTTDMPVTLSITDKPATLSIADKPATLSIAVKPATLSIAVKPSTLSIADKPETLSIADKPETLSIADKPEPLSIVDGPVTLAIADKSETLSIADKPATLSIADKPATLSIADKPATLSIAARPATLSIAVRPTTLSTAYGPSTAPVLATQSTAADPLTLSANYISKFSIHLNPAQLPQRKHALYQLLGLSSSSKNVKRLRLCPATSSHASAPAPAASQAPLPAILRKYWNISL